MPKKPKKKFYSHARGNRGVSVVPVSVRLTAADFALLDKLKARWNTEGIGTTIRKALEVAAEA